MPLGPGVVDEESTVPTELDCCHTPVVGHKFTVNELYISSVGFVFANGLCGLISVAFAANIEALAENVGTKSVDIGGVFIVRGVGNIAGSLLFPMILRMGETNSIAEINGTQIIALFTALFVAITACVSFCTSEVLLYFLFFGSGLFGSLVDTGCMSLLHKVHREKAGPWMTASILAFTVSAVISVFIQAVSNSTLLNFVCISIIGVVSFLWLLLQTNIEPRGEHNNDDKQIELTNNNCGQNSDNKKRNIMWSSTMTVTTTFLSTHMADIICPITLMFTTGSAAMITAYLETYASDTGVIATTVISYLLLSFWIGLTISNVSLLFIPTTNMSTYSLIYITTVLSLLTAATCIPVLIDVDSALTLWITTPLLGLFIGMTPGLTFSIANKLTEFNELSTAILMVCCLIVLLLLCVCVCFDCCR